MSPDDTTRLLHMIEAGESIARFLMGRDRGALDSDEMLLLAVVRALEIFGEAASQLSEEARIADEVISHLAGLMGTEVTVTLEIEAKIPCGAPENVVRTITENSRTLRFTSQGFEKA